MAEQFVFASMSACTATTIVHPLDVIRVKMQISKAGEGGIVERITNGPKGYRGLYAGLSAGLLRQLTYGTGRIGVYNVLLDAIGGPSVPFTSKVAVGITAGSFGGLVGNPAEVVLVRMAAGGRGYKHVCDALSRIVKEEGPSALLTGVIDPLWKQPSAAWRIPIDMRAHQNNDFTNGPCKSGHRPQTWAPDIGRN